MTDLRDIPVVDGLYAPRNRDEWLALYRHCGLDVDPDEQGWVGLTASPLEGGSGIAYSYHIHSNADPVYFDASGHRLGRRWIRRERRRARMAKKRRRGW